MAVTQQHKENATGKYLIVYVCLLALAGIQFVIAYQNIDPGQMFVRMMIVAFVEALLAVLIFMHLWAESRAFVIFVACLQFLCCSPCNMDGQTVFAWSMAARLIPIIRSNGYSK